MKVTTEQMVNEKLEALKEEFKDQRVLHTLLEKLRLNAKSFAFETDPKQMYAKEIWFRASVSMVREAIWAEDTNLKMTNKFRDAVRLIEDYAFSNYMQNPNKPQF